jgi:hypothetical protein
MLAATLLTAAAFWYLALGLNLSGVIEFAGLRFFWTAVLGLGPFVCLALSALLADAHVRSANRKGRLVWSALAAGLSPWLWSAAGLWFAIN